MKKLISVLLSFSLFLTSCTSVKSVAGGAIDVALDKAGVPDIIQGSVKKAVMTEEEEWDDGYTVEADIIYSQVLQSQKYLQGLF